MNINKPLFILEDLFWSFKTENCVRQVGGFISFFEDIFFKHKWLILIYKFL